MKITHRIGTIKSQEDKMVETIKTEESNLEETIKPEEKEMQKGTNRKETNMEETTKSQEKDMDESINVTEEDMHKNDETRQKGTSLKEPFSLTIDEVQEVDVELKRPPYIPNPNPNTPSNIVEDKRKKRRLKYYSDPYKSNIDPGVPAPLRLYWSEVDKSTKNKYPTAKECYLGGKFSFRRFLDWIEKHRKTFIELSRENKKISIRELDKCYGKDGELNGWKLGELLEEKRIFLEEKIKSTKTWLEIYNNELYGIEKLISRGCIDSDGLTEVERI